MEPLTVLHRDPQHNHLEKTWGEGPIIAPQPKFPFNSCYYYKEIKSHAQKHLQEHVFPQSRDTASPSLCCSLHSQGHSCVSCLPLSWTCITGVTQVSPRFGFSCSVFAPWQGKHIVCSNLYQLDTCSSCIAGSYMSYNIIYDYV